MALKFLFVACALFTYTSSSPTPVESKLYGTDHRSAAEVYNTSRTIDQAVLAAYGCVGQSCVAADFAGASGRPPTAKPMGGSDADAACVAHYSPEAAQFIKQYNGRPPSGARQDTGVSSMLMSGINNLFRPLVSLTGATDKVSFEQLLPVTDKHREDLLAPAQRTY
jgi:hypothetical protein